MPTISEVAHADDRLPLQELADIATFIQKHRTLQSQLDSCIRYWPEIVFKQDYRGFPLNAIKLLPGGGFSIINPVLWDEVLKRACTFVRGTNNIFIEFSRGNDPFYFKFHNISRHDVYLKSISILLNHCKWLESYSHLIIAVDCHYHMRFARNRTRRRQLQNNVADQVMRTVYRHSHLSKLLLLKTLRVKASSKYVDIPLEYICTNGSSNEASLAFSAAYNKYL
jgi:hypothetical protein